MARSYWHNSKSIKVQATVSSPNPTGPKEVFVNVNYLDELCDTEYKRTIINFIKNSKSLKIQEETAQCN